VPYRITNSKRNITCVKQTYTTERKLNSVSSERLFCRYASVNARCITKMPGRFDEARPFIPVFGGLCSAATGTDFRPHGFVSVHYILEIQNGVALLVPCGLWCRSATSRMLGL
jgi:hypothetical protein